MPFPSGLIFKGHVLHRKKRCGTMQGGLLGISFFEGMQRHGHVGRGLLGR